MLLLNDIELLDKYLLMNMNSSKCLVRDMQIRYSIIELYPKGSPFVFVSFRCYYQTLLYLCVTFVKDLL